MEHIGRVALIQCFCGETDGKRPLGRPRRRWENNIKMNLQEVECEFLDWIYMDQVKDRRRALVNAVLHLHVP